MNFSLLIGILVSFVAIVPHSSIAIKCFKCKSESDCEGNYNFRNESKNKAAEYVDEGCTFNPDYIPACKYIINQQSVVRERGCGGVGVSSREPFCTNRFKDVLICYCTTDWCNGIDRSNSAVTVAQDHFRRQEEKEERENNAKNAAQNVTMTVLWLTLIMGLNFIAG